MMSGHPAQSPLYAVIDLGSNSFHMLITRQLADSVHVVDKVKRKVRLASGLDNQNKLSEAAIARGLECLSFFAERLRDIPNENVRIVATATVRLASNQHEFLARANKVLGQDIRLLSGEQEAEYIYQGVAHTSCGEKKRLVLDIGGASTEIIVGEDTIAKKVVSLDIGCVTFNHQFFTNGLLTQNNFSNAIAHAKKIVSPLVTQYKNVGWQIVLGGSGTMQALAEILMHNRQPSIIKREFLGQIQQELIQCGQLNNVSIAGLASDRTPVIASGLAILIALFEAFEINRLQLSSGALREGLLYEMITTNPCLDIRQRTINSLTQRFHVDTHHAQNVALQATSLFESFASTWQLEKDNSYSLLNAACQLHEVGLLLEFKHHQQHSAYIVENAQMPGFDQADKQLLSALVKMYKADIDLTTLQNQSACSFQTACYLLAMLRLSVILCRRRQDDDLPPYKCLIEEKTLKLCLPLDWLKQHPLIADELIHENAHLSVLGLSLTIQC